ncbi:MAG: zinc-ribbon domain containing protein [Candidatus Zixiibacteriota bacterium]
MGQVAKSSILVCVSCGEEFVFTTAAQEYYHSLGYTGQPLRCKSCYKRHKHEKKSEEIRLRVIPGNQGSLYSRA